jgi:hypothetical protein
MDLGGGSKEFIARGLAAIKAMPVEDARRDEVAKRLWGLLGTGGADAEVQNGACDALMTWADDSVKDLALAALRPDGGEDAKRPYAIRLLVHFKDIRAVKPLCDALAQNRNVPEVSAALAEFGPASEEFLIKMLASGDGGQQTNACEVLREAGTRRCFRALQAIANPKGGGDERMKKLAAQTIIDINRRLNSAAAREAAGGAGTGGVRGGGGKGAGRKVGGKRRQGAAGDPGRAETDGDARVAAPRAGGGEGRGPRRRLGGTRGVAAGRPEGPDADGRGADGPGWGFEGVHRPRVGGDQGDAG